MNSVIKGIRSAVLNRLEKSIDIQKAVMDKVHDGRPLDAEPNNNRKLAYIQKVVGVSSDIAQRIANYEDPQKLPISPVKRSKAESIQGSTVDFLDICFLDKARAASRTVARVAYLNGKAQGTGFMVSPNLFLTNQHVIQDKEKAKNFLLEFDYELDFNRNAIPFTRFKLDPDKLFISDPIDDLDFTLIAVGDRVDGPLELTDFGYLPLINSIDKHIRAMFVNIVQHPDGKHKQLVVRENRILYDSAHTLIYGSDTLPGASGSPVLNDDWEVVGLHHWGEPYRAFLDQNNNPIKDLPQNGNEGIRISAIINHLNSEVRGLTNAQASLLREALEPGFRVPSLIKSKSQLDNNNININSKHIMESSTVHQEAPSSLPKADGTVTWTIPLTVSVQLGNVQQMANNTSRTEVSEKESISGAETFTPDPDYSNRRGYDPSFLGIRLDLPQLSEDQKQIAARKLISMPNADPFELKYQHFSIAMNAKDRLAFYTAVNIDGASVVNINRKTGKISRVENPNFDGAEAYEEWFNDDRIDKNQQTDQSLYDDGFMRQYFQRGHLVKRTDSSWGTPDRAMRGQADTFHFTNCAPQHEGFNPIATRWAGVENWITDKSDVLNIRVTVFSGPIFGDHGPSINGIQIPMRFWKIIVWVEDDRLQATGILADQGDLVKSAKTAAAPGGENFRDLPSKLVKVEQCSIKEIQELTSLDFGILAQHDINNGVRTEFSSESFDALVSRINK